MVKGLISRLDLVTCAVKHTTLLTSQHWHTRSRTRNPLHCVPLLHPTVTGTTVPLYRTCTYNILWPHTLTQPHEDPVHMSQVFPMSQYDLRKKKPSEVLLVECQKSGCGVGAAWWLLVLVLVPELRFLKWKQRREIFVPCLGRGRR